MQYIFVIPKQKQQNFLSSLNDAFNFSIKKCSLSGDYYIYTLDLNEDENKDKLSAFQDSFL